MAVKHAKPYSADTLGFPVIMNFTVTTPGDQVLKFDPTGQICMKGWKINKAGQPIDTTPPGKVDLMGAFEKK
jgi:hypothetical protein